MRAFIVDTFPALANDGFDLLFADSNKTLHLIPQEIDTPDKLKSYATGRSAVYIRPKKVISLDGSSSKTISLDHGHSTITTPTSCNLGTTNQEQYDTSPNVIEAPPQMSDVVTVDGLYSVPNICGVCKKSIVLDDSDWGKAEPCGHLFHQFCIEEWHKVGNHVLYHYDDEATGGLPKTKCPDCAEGIESITRSIISEDISESSTVVDENQTLALAQPSTVGDVELPSFSEVLGLPIDRPVTPDGSLEVIACDVYVPMSIVQLRSNIAEKRILTIRRQTLFHDLLLVYEDPLLTEMAIEMQVLNEDAVDLGGVTRDVFSSFWDQLINDTQLFSGTDAKVPIFNASNAAAAMKTLPIVGRILSHSYMVTGCFPTSLSLVSVISMFVGANTPVSDDILLNGLYEFLPQPESKLLQQALSLSSFDESTMSRLIDIYATNGLNRIPTPSTLRTDILYLSTFLLRLQPQVCFSTILSGLTDSHKLAWSLLTVDDFIKIYYEQSLDPEKLIKALKPPEDEVLSSDQENVLYYLKTFIREASPYILKRLMRFSTGSNNLLVSRLPVTFHKAEQLPKSMTCANTLILPSSVYKTYSSFKNDFLSILTNEDSFKMLCA